MRLLNRPIEFNLNSISIRTADEAFAYLWNAAVAHMRHCMTDVPHPRNPRTQELCKAARSAARSLRTWIEGESHAERAAFVRRHETWLPLLYSMLAGDLIEMYAGLDVRDAVRGAWDMWAGLVGLAGRDPHKKFLKCVGRLFGELVRGITVFDEQLITDEKDPTWIVRRGPLYHRVASCGPRQESGPDNSIRGLRADRIWRCYLERVIYNQVFRRIMGVQDYGHLVFITKLVDHMQHVFPGREVTDVTVRYLDEHPCTLEVSYHNSKEAVTEIYMHKQDFETGKRIVACRKKVHELLSPDVVDRIPIVRMYAKVQSFDTGEAPWVEEKGST